MKQLIQKLEQRRDFAMKGSHDYECRVERDNHMFTAETVFRYRFQRGVNLGSWFVLERWITDEPFKNAASPAQSDLDVALGPQAKEVLENHRDTWIQDNDWRYLSDHSMNSVRIPVGYYHLCGADRSFLDDTDFFPVYDIYRGAWSRITRAVLNAAEQGIGVFLGRPAYERHCSLRCSQLQTFMLPRGNKTTTPTQALPVGQIFLGTRTINDALSRPSLKILVTHLKTFTRSFNPSLPNVIGIELLNQPAPPSDEPLKEWYCLAIEEIRSIDPEIPIYVGDCWRPEVYADFIRNLPAYSTVGPSTVIDHHLYRCFTRSDICTPASVHTRAMTDCSSGILRQLAGAAEMTGRAGGGFIVGEWSAALNRGSLTGSPAEQWAQQREWAKAQLAIYDKLCGGWFFWTYKKQWRGDVGWSWKDSVEAGVFPELMGVQKREGFTYNRDDINHKKRSSYAKKAALDQHTEYWARYPGTYDHPRFSLGYTQGWHDALRFLASETWPYCSASKSQLGFKAAWARKSTSDHEKNYWEYETGFEQGVEAATQWYSNDI